MPKRSRTNWAKTVIDEVPEKSTFAAKIAEVEMLASKAAFVRNPLADDSAKCRQRDDEEFMRAYNRDLTRPFHRYLYWKIAHRENIDLSFYGVPRGGKTGAAMSVALSIASLSCVPFPLDASHIFRNQSEFLRAKNSPMLFRALLSSTLP